MMAPSHVAIGLAAWVVAAPLLHAPVLQPVSLGLVVMGSLLPDVDHPASWVGRRLRPLSSVLAAVLGHRGITHSAVAIAVLVVSLLQWGRSLAEVWPLAIGYGSHLAADMLTPRGLRLAWPLRRSWGLPLCRTGSPSEGVVVALVLSAAWWSVSGPRRTEVATVVPRLNPAPVMPVPPVPPAVPPRMAAPGPRAPGPRVLG